MPAQGMRIGELLLDPRMAHRAPVRSARRLTAVLIAIAGSAVVLPTLVVLHAPHGIGHGTAIALPRRVIPPGEVPSIEPVRLVDLSPEAARAYNGGRPFADGPVQAARPFRLADDADDRARAADCLAAAVLYEAGDDASGERAVAQVVLNRLRHPAFPKSVCAVVFEGAERATGCQFTFTCDGALDRWHPGEAAWRRAREVAAAALAGSVDRRVGYATHYHTDWVVPYWQASLDKVAAVGAHLFFRWTGWWGTPAAFVRQPVGTEPTIAALAPVSAAHRVDAPSDDASAIAPAAFFGRTLKPLATDPDTFLTSLDPARTAESYRDLAIQACGDRTKCLVLGWTDVSAMAFALPLAPEAQRALSFSYRRDRAIGFDRAQWNCAEFKSTPAGSCLRRPLRPEPMAATAKPAPDPDDALTGVRRRTAVPAPDAPPEP